MTSGYVRRIRWAITLLGGGRGSRFTRGGLSDTGWPAPGVNPATNANYAFLNRNGGSLRPNRRGDANSSIDPKVDRLHFLSSSGFAVQPLNTPGNSSRNVALGPKSFNTNLSLVKRFAVTEGSAIDLRFEAFNAFNNANFNNPNTNFGSANFGQITGAGDARQPQAAVRYRF
jgi:hypothetical protein